MADPIETWREDQAHFEQERPEIEDLDTYRPDLGFFHPYRHITVTWEHETCPRCTREVVGEAAIDIETEAVFCIDCTKKNLLEAEEAHAKAAAKPKPKPKEVGAGDAIECEKHPGPHTISAVKHGFVYLSCGCSQLVQTSRAK